VAFTATPSPEGTARTAKYADLRSAAEQRMFKKSLGEIAGFLSPNVANILVGKFNIKPIGTVEEHIAAMMARK